MVSAFLLCATFEVMGLCEGFGAYLYSRRLTAPAGLRVVVAASPQVKRGRGWRRRLWPANAGRLCRRVEEKGSEGSKGKVNARSAGKGALPFGQKVVSPEGKRLTTFYASLSLL